MTFNNLTNIEKYEYIQNNYPTNNIIYSLFNKNNKLIDPYEMYKDDEIFTTDKQKRYLDRILIILNKYPKYSDILLNVDKKYDGNDVRYLQNAIIRIEKR